MYFLEELVAQWYEYNGYFARTNIKFDKLKHGGVCWRNGCSRISS